MPLHKGLTGKQWSSVLGSLIFCSIPWLQQGQKYDPEPKQSPASVLNTISLPRKAWCHPLSNRKGEVENIIRLDNIWWYLLIQNGFPVLFLGFLGFCYDSWQGLQVKGMMVTGDRPRLCFGEEWEKEKSSDQIAGLAPHLTRSTDSASICEI